MCIHVLNPDLIFLVFFPLRVFFAFSSHDCTIEVEKVLAFCVFACLRFWGPHPCVLAGFRVFFVPGILFIPLLS